jgi:putative phosphoesterase
MTPGTIGVLSDTHGRLRADVLRLFAGVERILHAGDIGPPSILSDLEAIAPVLAVWGNTDGFEIRARVPEIADIEIAGRRIVMLHGHQLGSPTPAGLLGAYGHADIVIFGHTHRALVERIGGRLLLNPGSAGAPRFGQPASLALLRPGADDDVELVTVPG